MNEKIGSKVIELKGRKSSNLVGAIGENIAWDTLRKEENIQTFKIGIWKYSSSSFLKHSNESRGFLTEEQNKFVKNKVEIGITDYDFVGYKSEIGLEHDIEEVYLIEVKTGRKKNISRYINHPESAVGVRPLKMAKELGFKVLVVVIEFLEDWKYKVNIFEIGET